MTERDTEIATLQLQIVRLRAVQEAAQRLLDSGVFEVQYSDGTKKESFELASLRDSLGRCQDYEATQPAKEVMDATFRHLDRMGEVVKKIMAALEGLKES